VNVNAQESYLKRASYLFLNQQIGQLLKFFYLLQALGGVQLGATNVNVFLFSLPLQSLQLTFVVPGAFRQGKLLLAPGFKRLQAQHLALVLAEQVRTSASLFQAGLLERFLGLLNVYNQGLSSTLCFTQRTLCPVSPVPSQTSQGLDFTE